jgi:hypothetical protein
MYIFGILTNTSYKLDNNVICQSHYEDGSFGDCSDGLIHYNNAMEIYNNNSSQDTDCITVNNKLYCESK